MGDRGHVKIEKTGVVLYTHWNATELPDILATALSHEKRWHDPEYLGRIIFDHVSGRARDFTGAGIGTQTHSDAWRVLSVDCDEGTVTFEEGHGYGDDRYAGETYTFEEFVEEFHNA